MSKKINDWKRMKQMHAAAAGVIVCMCLLAGCGTQKEDVIFVEEELIEEEQPENPFAQKGGDLNTLTMGTISHGVMWGDNNTYCLTYEGGEMEIPYFMQGSGIAKNCGFLVFFDGVPQPYKVAELDTGYQYMHIFELEDEKDAAYTLRFTPAAGTAGERLSVCITSIINPSFMPDMKDSFSYGHSHKAMEAVYPVLFQADAGQDEALSEAVNEFCRKSLKNVELKEMETDRNFIEELEEETHMDFMDLEKDVYTRLYISGESMLLSETADIAGKDTVHIKYVILGHPGAEYKTVFYLNHEPLASEENVGENSFLSVLQSGQAGVIEFDLDTTGLDNSTFYAISVPCSSADYPDDVLMMYKSNSVVLYRSE